MNRQESLESRILRWADHIARMKEGSAFKILTGTLTGKRPLGRCRHRWKDNIRMNPNEIGIIRRSWIDSAENRDYWRAHIFNFNQ